jgi:hypothetical protein
MTQLGKLLAFLNLVVGLGIVTWSVSVFANRPLWNETAIPDVVEKGQSPESFAIFKQEIDTLGRAATAANQSWGADRKRLETAERRREGRLKGYETRLAWARGGNKDAGGAGFFQPVYEKDAAGKDTSVLDLTKLGAPIVGSDGQPLKGADTLLASFSKDVEIVKGLIDQIADVRGQIKTISGDIDLEETKSQKMTAIREAVQAELFYIAPFELNVYANRGTIMDRKRQLEQRINDLK